MTAALPSGSDDVADQHDRMSTKNATADIDDPRRQLEFEEVSASASVDSLPPAVAPLSDTLETTRRAGKELEKADVKRHGSHRAATRSTAKRDGLGETAKEDRQSLTGQYI